MQVSWYHLATDQMTTEHLTQNPHHTSRCGLLPYRVETIVQIMENVQFCSEKSLASHNINQSSVTLKLYRPHVPDPPEIAIWLSKNCQKLGKFRGRHATHKGCSPPSINFAYSLHHTDENGSSHWTTQLLHGGHVVEFPNTMLCDLTCNSSRN